MQRFWTPAKVEILKREWAAGANVRAIADMLGGSRNAIIGKAHRLRLPMHAGSLFHPDAVRKEKKAPKRKSERCVRIRRRKMAAPQSAPLPPPPLPPPPAAVSVEPRRIKFADLVHHHCLYPVTAEPPFLFCGHVRQKKSAYCSFHHALCHVKSRFDEARRAARPSRFNFALTRARAA